MNTFSAGVSSMTGFCASRDGEEVFTSGKLGPHDPFVIQRYNRTGQVINTCQVKCGHETFHFLHLSIGGKPYIAMSCRQCRSISLYSMTDSDPITAFSDEGKDSTVPYAMCHGPNNTILASNRRAGSREVLVYDVTSTQFTLKDRIPVDVDQANHIHYMETDQHGGIVIVSTWFPQIISAHSIESKTLVWKIDSREIDGKEFKPIGICSDPDTRALYVGDHRNERLIVLEPNTGGVIQSIQVPGVGYIYDIAWCPVQPHLVVRHDVDQITYFNIK